MHAVLQQKGNHDFGSANLSQHIAVEAMRSGKYLEQVEHLKQRLPHEARRDARRARALHAQGTPACTGRTRTAGLYVWLTLPESFDTSRGGMFEKAVDAGVLYVPGDYCFQPDEQRHVPTNHLRLSFGQVAAEQVEPGIEKLAGVVRAAAQWHGRPARADPTEHGRGARATLA